jgi:AraC-like DNA-binding protein
MAIHFDDRVIFASPLLRIVDIQWHASDPRPTPEYASDFAEITFQRRGMFVKHHGRRGVTCDSNTLLFINAGEPYHLTHPVVLDCACTALLVEPRVLGEMVGQYRRADPERTGELFPLPNHPSRAEFIVAHYKLLSLAQADHAVDPLAIEEFGLNLAARITEAAFATDGGRRRSVRPSTARAHADAAQAVKELLAARLQDRLTLTQIARHAHCAPSHLCRVFREQTGVSIHRYLTRLRLAVGLERLAEADLPLSRLAVELGFSHHSHFSTAFLAEYGIQPSSIRRWFGAKRLRQIRKILKARGSLP